MTTFDLNKKLSYAVHLILTFLMAKSTENVGSYRSENVLQEWAEFMPHYHCEAMEPSLPRCTSLCGPTKDDEFMF